jgi:hypothetical protein
MSEGEQEEQLLQSKVRSARGALEEAQANLANASGHEAEIWRTRVESRQQELDKAVSELENFENSRLTAA